MQVIVYIREEHLGDHTADFTPSYDSVDPIHGYAIGIEHELAIANIYFQSTSVRDTDAITILCNDAEEREHIKHTLMKHHYVLAIDVEGRRFFSKFATDDEKARFKYLKSLTEEKKKEIDELRRIEKETAALEMLEAQKDDL